MPTLAHQRCFNHSQREAAARCVECRQFFCRECVAEHDDRIVCASCLQKLAKKPATQRRALVGVLRFFQCAFSLMLLWFFFYLIGEGLISIPTPFHEGTLWNVNWMDQP
jgi:hypothetical protein